MEANITTIGTVLLGAFYAIGFLLNRQSKKKTTLGFSSNSPNEEHAEFITTLSSTASQSTSLNIQLWQKIADLEDKLEENHQEIEMLKFSNQQKDQRISDLEEQIHQIQLKNSELLGQLQQLEQK